MREVLAFALVSVVLYVLYFPGVSAGANWGSAEIKIQANQDYWNAACVLIFTSICNDPGSYYVNQDYWNAAFVLIFISICNDLGSYDVVQDYCSTAFVLICISICNNLGLEFGGRPSYNHRFE